MLKGKARGQFKKYLFNCFELDIPMFDDLLPFLYDFEAMPLSMQWGVYQDFFESLDISISIILNWNVMTEKKEGYVLQINDMSDYHKEDLYWEEYKTLNEARTKAIEKLNEIINNENNN